MPAALTLHTMEPDASIRHLVQLVEPARLRESATPRPAMSRSPFSDILESDWKLFRQRLPGWQERHMQKLLDEYAAIIAGAGNPSAKFWTLEECLRKDIRHAGVCVERSRSTMVETLFRLLDEKAIDAGDLDGFSDGLRHWILR